MRMLLYNRYVYTVDSGSLDTITAIYYIDVVGAHCYIVDIGTICMQLTKAYVAETSCISCY